MLRVDFDGRTYGPGKAVTAASYIAIVDRTATAYFSVVESGYASDKGYFFLGYYWYHPKDNGSVLDSGHEHDLEGAMFLVKKSAYLPYGTLVLALTQAHGELVPYYTSQSPIQYGAVGSPYLGVVNFWPDPRNGTQRPVLVVRARNHGTHAPQTCNASGQGSENGFGIFWNAQPSYTACIHSGNQWILYEPNWLFNGGGSSLDIGTRSGNAIYQLSELYTSPIWTDRGQYQDLFSGGYAPLTNSDGGFLSFYSLTDPNQANPPWQWRGGGGCFTKTVYFIGQGTGCWYGYDVDGEYDADIPQHWPVSPSYGRLLTDPAAEMRMRFTGLPDLGEFYRYNPYVTAPPNYYASGPPLTSISIAGPNTVPPRVNNQWTATVSGGTPPYAYRWSGAASGTAQSVTGAPATSQPLYLDVWDSAGGHLLTSLYITVDQCLDPHNPC
jgi:hypothetical protein